MQTLPLATPQRAAQSCPSPVEIWQQLLMHLLEQHYGLTLSDTPFSNETTIREHIDAGISLNFLKLMPITLAAFIANPAGSC